MSSTTIPAGLNLAILVGTLSRTPELRSLPSGDEVLSLELTIRADDGPSESVPVSWFHPPAAARRWDAGQELVVTGRTRKRFFRVAGTTQSRTDVVASAALPTRRGASARKAILAALDEVEQYLEGTP